FVGVGQRMEFEVLLYMELETYVVVARSLLITCLASKILGYLPSYAKQPICRGGRAPSLHSIYIWQHATHDLCLLRPAAGKQSINFTFAAPILVESSLTLV